MRLKPILSETVSPSALAFLNVKGHASYSSLAAFMKNVCGEPVSRGQIAKTLRRVSAALEVPHSEAIKRLPDEPVLNIETGTANGENTSKGCVGRLSAALRQAKRRTPPGAL